MMVDYLDAVVNYIDLITCKFNKLKHLITCKFNKQFNSGQTFDHEGTDQFMSKT
jgi:hypothetical protein